MELNESIELSSRSVAGPRTLSRGNSGGDSTGVPTSGQGVSSRSIWFGPGSTKAGRRRVETAQPCLRNPARSGTLSCSKGGRTTYGICPKPVGSSERFGWTEAAPLGFQGSWTVVGGSAGWLVSTHPIVVPGRVAVQGSATAALTLWERGTMVRADKVNQRTSLILSLDGPCQKR